MSAEPRRSRRLPPRHLPCAEGRLARPEASSGEYCGRQPLSLSSLIEHRRRNRRPPPPQPADRPAQRSRTSTALTTTTTAFKRPISRLEARFRPSEQRYVILSIAGAAASIRKVRETEDVFGSTKAYRPRPGGGGAALFQALALRSSSRRSFHTYDETLLQVSRHGAATGFCGGRTAGCTSGSNPRLSASCAAGAKRSARV